MPKWFHSASREIAQSILNQGYHVVVDDNYFSQPLYADHGVLQRGLVKMLPGDIAQIFTKMDIPLDGRNYDRLVAEWLKIYAGGTILWVMPDSPDVTYGDVHLEVIKLPVDATTICQDNTLGWAFYTEEPTIDATSFKLVD